MAKNEYLQDNIIIGIFAFFPFDKLFFYYIILIILIYFYIIDI